MKKILIRITTFTLILCLVFSLAACGAGEKEPSGLWADALYQEDTELGSGSTVFRFLVEAEGKTVTFTVSTDLENLAEILLEHQLIAGEEGDYGIYVKKVNGITADYDIDGSYWSLYENGESAMSGVSGISVKNGGEYRFVRQK
jgi:hypothetical protein